MWNDNETMEDAIFTVSYVSKQLVIWKEKIVMTNKEMYLDTVEDMTSEAFSDTVEELETKLNKNES